MTALRMAEKDGELGNGARAPTETACQAAAFSVVRSAGMHHRHAAIDRLPELVESCATYFFLLSTLTHPQATGTGAVRARRTIRTNS